jgi:predicted nucleic acid-binding protein
VIVVDASVLANVLADDSVDGRRARTELPFMRRAYELRATVTPYDAVYVALAEALGCELVTTDGRLAKATGPRCAIRVL